MTTSGEKTFNDLRESFREGRLIPFVGAGFSMIDANAPSWDELINKVAHRYKINDDPVLKALSDPLEKAEYLKKQWKKKKLAPKDKIEEIVASILHDHPKFPSNLKPHRILLENFDRIYTTNYDKYFEDVAEYLGIKMQNVPELPLGKSKSTSYITGMLRRLRAKFFAQSTVPAGPQHLYITRNTSSNRTGCDKNSSQLCDSHKKARRLVKYHGDYRIPDSLVLTETSYFQRLMDVDAKDILFAGDALFYDFLFLGYGFADMSLKFTLQQLERTFETLGNVVTGETATKKRQFFILRTDDRYRNQYQDIAYDLRSLNMADANFVKGNLKNDKCCLISFRAPPGRRHEVINNPGEIQFSSFYALWSCAEAKADERYCECGKSECTNIHFDNNPISQEMITTAQEFRAYVFNEGFTKFLEELVSP